MSLVSPRLIAAVTTALAGIVLVGCGSSAPTTDSAGTSSGGSTTAVTSGSTPVPKGALLDAAIKAAVDFGTYDYKTIKQNGWAFLNDLTASFKAGYAGYSDQFVTATIQGQSASTAKATSTSLISQTADKAVVSVAISQAMTGTANSMNTITSIQLTLLKQADGSWLVDGASLAK